MTPTETEGAQSRAWVIKIGSVGGIAGALIGMIGNLIHPAPPADDTEALARAIASSDIWVVDHLAIVVALILMLGGLVALRASIEGAIARALATLAHGAAVAGATVGLVLVTLDGLAARQLALEWSMAGPAEAAMALRVFAAEETMNFALASLFNILFAGFAFGLYGLAIVFDRAHRRWVGWVALVAGGGSIVAGLIQAAAGAPTPVTRILTIVFPTVITLWLAGMSVAILRRSFRAGARSAA